MTPSREQQFHTIMSGSDRSASARFLRLAAACAEPFYSAAMRSRNALYNTGILPARTLGRPTISVGNLTAGGTGKTPVVQWLAERLLDAGHRPAILLRGYKKSADGTSDEAELLHRLLDGRAPVIADPDRLRGAAFALRVHSDTTVFILDDAMQHRRAVRNLEIVLINAREPFGYGHVLPRGLLREPLDGLKRAGAVLITHAGEVDAAKIENIEAIVRRHNADVAMFRCNHEIAGFRSAATGGEFARDHLSGKSYFAFCGIGDPDSFFASLKPLAGRCAGERAFPDHHAFTAADLADIEKAAREKEAEVLVATEKESAKLLHLRDKASATPPLFIAGLELRFEQEDQRRLIDLVKTAIPNPS